MSTNFHVGQFKHRLSTDPKEIDKAWSILEHAIHEIYNHNERQLKFEELYRNAYNMVLHNFGERLYSGVVATMTAHLKEIARSIEATQEGFFLEEMNRKWNSHDKKLNLIAEILMYMDRTYVRHNGKLTVHKLGLKLWRENVIYSKQIRTRLLHTLLELVSSERAGVVINRGLFKNITKMLMDLRPSDVYEEVFETRFLQVSAEFYQLESQKFIECCSCGDYLKKAESCLNEEMDRVRHYLDPSTEKKITKVVAKEMIENHMLTLIRMENSGLVSMLCEDKYEDLGRIYHLFGFVNEGQAKVREVMTSHIRQSGKKLVTDPERLKDPVELVQMLLDEKHKYNKIINLGFLNDKSIQRAIESSFKCFINLNPRSPEFVSLFVDDKLRKGLEGVSEDDVKIALDNVMMLFRYLKEKDMFEKYYEQHLAERLLSGKTVSADAENSLINRLSTQCSCDFICRSGGMLTDMEISQYKMQGFYASHPELSEGPTLTVQLLTVGFWPIQSTVICNLPAEMSALCGKFRSYYLGTETVGRLTWQTNMGTADIKATFGKGQTHELNVSTYQMCVLMLFNTADRLSYKEIEQATEIPASDLKTCLQSLALVKGGNVLRKDPVSNDVGEDDAFFVNDTFSSNLYKVKIGTVVAQNESEPEKLETWQQVEEDQGSQIEAAIVRIMKSRKKLDHNKLMAEVTKQLQLQFHANPTEVNKRIESLVDRDFMERDDNDRQLYRYLN